MYSDRKSQWWSEYEGQEQNAEMWQGDIKSAWDRMGENLCELFI